jgi:hypothetical protein
LAASSGIKKELAHDFLPGSGCGSYRRRRTQALIRFASASQDMLKKKINKHRCVWAVVWFHIITISS